MLKQVLIYIIVENLDCVK